MAIKIFPCISVWLMVSWQYTWGESTYCVCDYPRRAVVDQTHWNKIQSPNYPYNYNDNTLCDFVLEVQEESVCSQFVIHFEVQSLSTESGYDYVDIYDGREANESQRIVRLEGSSFTNPIVTTKPVALIRFRSDGSNTGNGFLMRFRAATAVLMSSPGDIDIGLHPRLSMPQTTMVLQSPGFNERSYMRASNYTTEVCAEQESIFRFQFSTLSLKESDSVRISTRNRTIGEFSGEQLVDPLFDTGRSYSIEFISRGQTMDDVQGGFKMHITKYPVPSTATPTDSTCNASLLIATSGKGYITSPGFPNAYNSSLRCSWLISSDDPFNSVVKIHIQTLELEKDFDILRFYDGMSTESEPLAILTGNNPPNVIYSTGRDMFIVFTTDRRNQEKGFKLSYTKANALPSFTGTMAISGEDGIATLSAAFISVTPFDGVYWYNDDKLLTTNTNTTISTREIRHNSSLYEEENDFETSLVIHNMRNEDYSMYSVIVQNNAGIAELQAKLTKPYKIPEILSQNLGFFGNSSYIDVHIVTDLPLLSVGWRMDGVQLSVGDKYRWEPPILLSPGSSTTMEYLSRLTIKHFSVHDFRTYEVRASNDAGEVNRYIKFDYSLSVIPDIVGLVSTDLNTTMLTIVACFKSAMDSNTIKWFKDDELLSSNTKYIIGPARRYNDIRFNDCKEVQADVATTATA